MISRSDFVALKTFIVVAERLNFRGAAEHLGLAPSAASQQIRSLECRLGLRLFNRTTRSVNLTHDGQALYRQVAPLLENLAETFSHAHIRSHEIKGTVHIHAFRAAAQMFLDYKVPTFLAEYPDVHVDITISDTPIELATGGYDFSLRLGELPEPGLVTLPVGGPLHQIVVAAPVYLEQHGTPEHPDDLRQHNCIGWRWPGTVTPEPWQFRDGERIITFPATGNLVVDDRERQYQAAIAGTGIAQVMAERIIDPLFSGALVPILTPWEMEFEGYYLCWMAGKTVSPAMRALIDALRED